jgi:hypothetical protein
MNQFKRDRELASESELVRVVEPLASYICATGEPHAALLSALAVLFSEVAQTSKAATAQVAAFSENL